MGLSEKEKKELRFFFTMIAISVLLAFVINAYNIELPKSGFIRGIADWIINIIDETKYIGVLFLMILESALLPVPSEVIMPFAGFIAYLGHMDIILIVIAGTIGNVIGSVIAYYAGLYGGRGFVKRYGKYIFLRDGHVNLAEKLFNDYGEIMIFIGRMLPAVRTVISFPAGVGKMNFKKFLLYTTIGSIPWNFALTYIGYILGSKWYSIISFFENADLIFVAALVIILIYFIKTGAETN